MGTGIQIMPTSAHCLLGSSRPRIFRIRYLARQQTISFTIGVKLIDTIKAFVQFTPYQHISFETYASHRENKYDFKAAVGSKL